MDYVNGVIPTLSPSEWNLRWKLGLNVGISSQSQEVPGMDVNAQSPVGSSRRLWDRPLHVSKEVCECPSTDLEKNL